MTDVVHDPRTDWCACEPESDDRCSYRLLADAVVAAFNPPDCDEAEVSILIDAVERVASFVASLPCHCGSGVAAGLGEPCARCQALGQRCGKAEQR